MIEVRDDPVLLTKKLIGFKSITPDDDGSIDYIASIVEQSSLISFLLRIINILDEYKNG